MRSIETILYLGDAERLTARARGKTVIAVDVFRATTTLTTAFANGAAQAIPVLSPDEALCMKADRFPDALLGGERESVRIKGFDLANSPRDYTRDLVRGRTILFTTTNGTRLLRSVESAARVFLAALINVDAVCSLVACEVHDLLIACAGSHGHVTMEDVLCAGVCVARLRDGYGEVDAASRACELLWTRFGPDPHAALAECEHGANLVRLGLDEDLPYATCLNRTNVVAELCHGVIRPVSATAATRQ